MHFHIKSLSLKNKKDGYKTNKNSVSHLSNKNKKMLNIKKNVSNDPVYSSYNLSI